MHGVDLSVEEGPDEGNVDGLAGGNFGRESGDSPDVFSVEARDEQFVSSGGFSVDGKDGGGEVWDGTSGVARADCEFVFHLLDNVGSEGCCGNAVSKTTNIGSTR